MRRRTALSRPVIGYTLGDQAGIGPEIIGKALHSPALSPHAEYRQIGQRVDCTPGRPSRDTAEAAFEHLEMAAEALSRGTIDAVVTAPVYKEGLHRVGFPFPGQTEFFADRLGVRDFAMCLTGERLTVALATTHMALADVPGALKTEELCRVGLLLACFLRRMGRESPCIALAGLNPHNGESGAFGDEEKRLIAPAVACLRRADREARFCGPCVPDCVYRDAVGGLYDAVIAPYHDQALIPLKLIDFESAVNVTIGLPRLRVSPDHGTAFGIAGKNLADPSSTIRAFQLAVKSSLSDEILPESGCP